MNKISPKGTCNDLIRQAIAKGLSIKDGRIVLPSGKFATYMKTRAGYDVINLGPENKRRVFLVGRIICWLTHGEPPTEAHQVDHINRDRSDDRPENLRWFSASQNALNISEESKRRSIENCRRIRDPHRGEKHPFAKLSEKDVQEIRASKQSQYQLAKQFCVRQSTISKIKNGKSRK
jgi:hypothetical protein